MPVISSKARLVYFDVPKVACTSLKTFFWELDNGAPFRTCSQPSLINRIIGRIRRIPRPIGKNIHYAPGYQTWSYMRSKDSFILPEGFQTMVVLRDPIDRIYSAWCNKINIQTFSARDETEDLLNEMLSLQPTFGEFLRNYYRYREASRPVRIHTQSYHWHLGAEIDQYDIVYRLEAIRELQDFLQQRVGQRITLPRQNKTDRISPSYLNDSDLEILLTVTKSEYEWTKGLYNQSEAIDKFLKRFGKSR